MATTESKTIQLVLQVISKSGAVIDQTARKFGLLAKAEQQATTQQTKFNAGIDKVKAKLQQLGGQLDKTGRASKSVGQQFASLAGNFAQFAAIAGSALVPLKSFAEFERSMSEVGAIAQASGAELDRLTQRADATIAVARPCPGLLLTSNERERPRQIGVVARRHEHLVTCLLECVGDLLGA